MSDDLLAAIEALRSPEFLVRDRAANGLGDVVASDRLPLADFLRITASLLQALRVERDGTVLESLTHVLCEAASARADRVVAVDWTSLVDTLPRLPPPALVNAVSALGFTHDLRHRPAVAALAASADEGVLEAVRDALYELDMSAVNMREREAAARSAWADGAAARAGRLIYEGLPPHRRPAWAARVLAVFLPEHDAPQPFRALFEIAAEPTRWTEARDVFRELRALNEAHQQLGEARDARFHALVSLAEKVAKVTYNATGMSAPFDSNSGWLVAEHARSLVEGPAVDWLASAVVEALFANPDRPGR